MIEIKDRNKLPFTVEWKDILVNCSYDIGNIKNIHYHPYRYKTK